MNERMALLSGLREHFSLSELHDICFELGIDYEDLPGATRGERARELLLYLERHQRVDDLLAICRRLRPKVAWPGSAAARAESIAAAIRPHLPASLQPRAAALAALLAELIADPARAPAVEAALRDDQAVGRLLAPLAGQQIATGGALIQFGAGSQAGDLTLRDVAGGGIVHLTINISPRA